MSTVRAPAAPPAAPPASRRRRQLLVLATLASGVAGVAVLSVCLGAVRLSPAQVVDGLTGGPHAFIIQQYRLPRTGVSVLAGAALAVAGALLQAAMGNPLASPDVIGITKGAGLGAMLAAILAPPATHLWALPAGVLAGAWLVTAVLLLVAGRIGSRGATLALAGIAIAALAGAAVQYLMVSFPQRTDQAMVWLAGSTHGSRPTDVLALAIWLAACLPAVLAVVRYLDLAGFGDDTLTSLGHHPAAARAGLVAVAVVLAAAAVAAVGGIGFLGLLAPHLARLLVGSRARWLLPVSALAGAMLLCLADLAGRLVALPSEIPAGIVAAVVGGPYLLYLLVREVRHHA